MSQDVDEMREAVGQLNGPPISESVTNTPLRPFLAQIARYWRRGALMKGITDIVRAFQMRELGSS